MHARWFEKIDCQHRFQFQKIAQTRCTIVFAVVSDRDTDASSTFADRRKPPRRPVARTPNRDFGNKKIFHRKLVYGSPPLVEHRFSFESMEVDSRARSPDECRRSSNIVNDRRPHALPRVMPMRYSDAELGLQEVVDGLRIGLAAG